MSEKLILYYFIGSMPSRACIILAKVLNIPVELRSINLSEREQHNDWYKKINPDKKVPVLVDGDFILTESRAIMAYLVDTRHPGSSLYPKDPKKRAAIDERLHFDGSAVFPKISKAFLSKIKGKSDIEFKRAVKELTFVIQILEEFLAKSEYFAGNEMTIADISILPNVASAYDIGVDLTQYPKLFSWWKKMQSIPGNDVQYSSSNMTDKLNIYCFIGSLPSRAVIILTKLLEIPCELNNVNILKGEQNSYWYKRINPAMKVPALADGYFTLSESRAILAYLVDTKMPGGCGLYPRDPKKRAKVDERLFFDAATFFPKVSSILQAYMKNKSECERKQAIEDLMPVLKTMEDFLGESEYFAGNEMTIADVSIFPTFTTVYDIGVDLSKFPKLISWCQKMQKIPGNDINVAGGKVLLEALGMKPKL